MKCHFILGVVSLFGLSLILPACGSGPSIPPAIDIAYVANAQSHSMSVVDIPANKIVSTIEIGNSPSTSLNTTVPEPSGVAVSPDGSRVYVTDVSTSVWVIHTKSNRVIDRIGAGNGPEGIAVTPDGKKAYVTTGTCGLLLCSGPGSLFAAVDVIDTETDSPLSIIILGQGSSGVTISPDGARAYVAGAKNNISVIDTTTNSIIAIIPIDATELDGIAASPDGTSVYVIGFVNSQANGTVIGSSYFVDVIDTKTDTDSTRITLSNIEELSGVAVTPDGGHAYVIGRGGDAWVIDTVKNAIMTTVQVSGGAELTGIALTPDGTRAYVSSVANRLIYVLDTSTNRVVDTVKSDAPGALAITRAM